MSLYDEMQRAQLDRHEQMARDAHYGFAWWWWVIIGLVAVAVIDVVLYLAHSPYVVLPWWWPGVR